MRSLLTSQQGMASAVMILMTAMLLSIASGLVYVNSKNLSMNRTSGDAVAAEQAAIGGVKHLMSYLDYQGWTGSNAQTWLDSQPVWQGTLTADKDNPAWNSTYNVVCGTAKDYGTHWEYTLTSTGTYHNVQRVVYAIVYVEKDIVEKSSDDITVLTSSNPTVFKTNGDEVWQVNKSAGSVDFDCKSGNGWEWMRFGNSAKYDLDDLAKKIKDGKTVAPMDIAYQLQKVTNYGNSGNGFGVFYLMQDGDFNPVGSKSSNGNPNPGVSGYVVQYDPGLTRAYKNNVGDGWGADRLGQVKKSDTQSADASDGFLLTRKTNKNINHWNGSNEDRNDDACAFQDNQGYDYHTQTNVPWYSQVVDISTDNNVFTKYNYLNSTTDVVMVPFEHVKPLLEYAYQQSAGRAAGRIGVETFNVSDNHRIEIKVMPVLTNTAVSPPEHDDVTAVYLDGVLVLRYIDRGNTGDPYVYNTKYTHGASGMRIWQSRFLVTNMATTHAGRKPYILKWKNN